MTTPIITARALLDAYWDLQIPIEPEAFAAKLGLRIVETPDMGLMSSSLERDDKIICLNADACPEHRRFAVARELGRWCLGFSRRASASELERLAVDPDEECRADQFALELLMPGIAVKAMMEIHRVRDPVAHRKAFGVSSLALYARLDALGYFL